MYGIGRSFRDHWGLGEAPPAFMALVIVAVVLAMVLIWQWGQRRIRVVGLVLLACTLLLIAAEALLPDQ